MRQAVAGIGFAIQDFLQVADAVAVPIGAPLGTGLGTGQAPSVTVTPRQVRVGHLRILALDELQAIEEPVAIRVLGRIVVILGIQPVGQLPNIRHAVEVCVIKTCEASVEAQAREPGLKVAGAIAIHVASVINRILRVKAIKTLDAIRQARAIGVNHVGSHGEIVGETIRVAVSQGRIEPMGKAGKQARGIDFLKIRQSIVVGIRVLRIAGGIEQQFLAVAEAIAVRVSQQWTGKADPNFIGVGKAIGVGIDIAGVGTEQVLVRIRQTIAIGVLHQRAAAPGHFQTVGQTVAIAVGIQGIRAQNEFTCIGEPIAIAVGSLLRRFLPCR